MHREGEPRPCSAPCPRAAPSRSAGLGSEVLSQLSASGSSRNDSCTVFRDGFSLPDGGLAGPEREPRASVLENGQIQRLCVLRIQNPGGRWAWGGSPRRRVA